MTKRKKIFILLTMVIVLGVAAYLNIILLNGNDPTDPVPASYFADYEVYRTGQRAQEFSYLDEVLALPGDEYADARQAAAMQKLRLVEVMETEMLLESRLKAKGYNEVIASVSYDSNNIVITIGKSEITREDTAKIYNVIYTALTVEPDTVVIQRM